MKNNAIKKAIDYEDLFHGNKNLWYAYEQNEPVGGRAEPKEKPSGKYGGEKKADLKVLPKRR